MLTKQSDCWTGNTKKKCKKEGEEDETFREKGYFEQNSVSGKKKKGTVSIYATRGGTELKIKVTERETAQKGYLIAV